MRILQVIPTVTTGGAERMLANLSFHLRRAGHTVGVVSMHDPEGPSVEAELRSQGAEFCSLGQRPGLDLHMIPRFARAVSRFRPQVLHTHLYVLKYVLPALAVLPRCPVVHTIHNLAEREVGGPERALQQVAFRLGVAPVAIGEAVAESVRRVYRLAPRRTIPNGIPVADYAPRPGGREAVRAELSIPDGAPVFVTVGRLMQQKNHAALIEAFASSRLRSSGAHLLLVGDGVLRRQLEARVEGAALGPRVHFLGQRADVTDLLAAADVFVLPSLWEGYPLSVMEAMAAGKPVVATAVGCVPELVSPATGRLVAPGDVEGLAGAMVELAADAALASAMGSAAASVARDRFDASVMASAYEALYREVA